MTIYALRNRINGKYYVGQTVVDPKLRLKRHFWNCTSTTGRMPISKAIKKYGKRAFEFLILCQCATQIELDWMERVYACFLNSFSPHGYNLRAGSGKGSLSVDTKNKISAAHIGVKASLETRRILSLSHLGIRQSPETCRKISEANKGRKGSPFCYARAIESNSGRFNLINPDGKCITIINMALFCRISGYSKSRMSELVNGRRKTYRGCGLCIDKPGQGALPFGHG